MNGRRGGGGGGVSPRGGDSPQRLRERPDQDARDRQRGRGDAGGRHRLQRRTPRRRKATHRFLGRRTWEKSTRLRVFALLPGREYCRAAAQESWSVVLLGWGLGPGPEWCRAAARAGWSVVLLVSWLRPGPLSWLRPGPLSWLRPGPLSWLRPGPVFGVRAGGGCYGAAYQKT